MFVTSSTTGPFQKVKYVWGKDVCPLQVWSWEPYTGYWVLSWWQTYPVLYLYGMLIHFHFVLWGKATFLSQMIELQESPTACPQWPCSPCPQYLIVYAVGLSLLLLPTVQGHSPARLYLLTFVIFHLLCSLRLLQMETESCHGLVHWSHWQSQHVNLHFLSSRF